MVRLNLCQLCTMEGEKDGLEMSHYSFGTQHPSWIMKEGNMCKAMRLICNKNT